MPFTYVDTHGTQFVDVALALGIPAGDPSISIGTTQPYVEPVIRSMLHSTWNVGWMAVEDTLGFFRDKGLPTKVGVLKTKPQNSRYSSQRDYQRYGSVLDSLRLLAGMLRGESISFLPGREHDVLHASYRGDIGPPLEDDLIGYFDPAWANFVGSDYGVGVVRPSYLPNESDGNTSQGMHAAKTIDGALFYTQITLASWAYYTDTVTALETLKVKSQGLGMLHFGTFWWGTPYFTSITDLDYEVVSLTKIVVRFTSAWSEYTVGPMWQWDVKITLTRDLGIPSITTHIPWDGDGWSGTIALTGAPLIEIESVLIGGFLVDYFDPGFSIGATWQHNVVPPSGWVYQSRAVRGDGTGFDSPDFVGFGRRRHLQSFANLIEVNARDIRASSFLSASDALDSLIGSIDTNLVEAAFEAGEVLSILPELRASIELIISLPGGNAVQTIKGLIDFATSLRLQQKFSIEPDVDLVLNVLPRLHAVAQRFARLRTNGFLVGRGDFHYDFPYGEFGREKSRLVTHSRVVCRLNSKGLLEDVLGIRAQGIIPDASHLWATLPFSFVVDWFVNIGGRLHDLESASYLLLASVTSYTHSYLVTSPLQEKELAPYGMRTSNLGSESVSPELRFYAREVSAHVPRIYDGRYDFHLPSRLPNWMTAGSLAWQLLSH